MTAGEKIASCLLVAMITYLIIAQWINQLGNQWPTKIGTGSTTVNYLKSKQ
jgi:hypothetical protein